MSRPGRWVETSTGVPEGFNHTTPLGSTRLSDGGEPLALTGTGDGGGSSQVRIAQSALLIVSQGRHVDDDLAREGRVHAGCVPICVPMPASFKSETQQWCGHAAGC